MTYCSSVAYAAYSACTVTNTNCREHLRLWMISSMHEWQILICSSEATTLPPRSCKHLMQTNSSWLNWETIEETTEKSRRRLTVTQLRCLQVKKQQKKTTRKKIHYKNQEQTLELNGEQQYKQVTILKFSNWNTYWRVLFAVWVSRSSVGCTWACTWNHINTDTAFAYCSNHRCSSWRQSSQKTEVESCLYKQGLTFRGTQKYLSWWKHLWEVPQETLHQVKMLAMFLLLSWYHLITCYIISKTPLKSHCYFKWVWFCFSPDPAHNSAMELPIVKPTADTGWGHKWKIRTLLSFAALFSCLYSK